MQKKKYTPFIISGIPAVVILILSFVFDLASDQKLPAPFETIIIDKDEDEKHYQKFQWIEEIHRSAPGDNWRQMDLLYRKQRLDSKSTGNPLPIYGKWREIGSNNMAGRTVCSYYDSISEKLYVAADGGQIWKGDIGLENWESLNDHFKISAIRFIKIISHNNGTRLLVGSSQWNVVGFMYSDDDGVNWTLASGLESIVSWGYTRRVVMCNDPSQTIYLLSQEWDYTNWHSMSKIYKSTDLGQSFTALTSFPYGANYVDLWAPTSGSGDVFLLTDNEFFKLEEDGTLISIAILPNQEQGTTMLTGFETETGIYFYGMVRFSNQSHFYASDIDGVNWQSKGILDEGPFMVNSFAASLDQQDLIYFGGVNAYSSINGGLSWVKVNDWGQYYGSPEDMLHADIPSFNPFLDNSGNEFLFINTDGGTYISFDHMENVDNISLNNLRISQYYTSYTCRFAPEYTHAGSQDQGYQMSDEGNQEGVLDYDQLIGGDYGNIVSGDGGASLWMVYPSFAMYCVDINNSVNFKYWDFIGSNYQWLPKLMDDPDDPASVYIAGGYQTSGAHIIHLHYTGSQFIYEEELFDFSNGTNANITAFAYSPLNPDYRYVLTSERDFFYSTDAGNSWTQTSGFTGPGSHYFYGASIVSSNMTQGLLYIGGSGYSNPAVFISSDHGQTFTDYSNGLPNTLVFQLVLSSNDSLLFAATEIGPFVCKTWENQWFPLSDSIVPDQAYWAVDYVDTLKVARFASYGRGIWDFELDPDVEADFLADKSDINVGDTISFTDQSLWYPTSWEWYFEGGVPDISSEQNPGMIIYPVAGEYDVRLIVQNQNSIDTLIKSEYIIVSPNTVIPNNTDIRNLLTIYPNPAKDHFYIKSSVKIDEVYIYSSTGKMIQHLANISPDQNNARINIEHLTPGVYFIQVLSDQKITSGKLLVSY